ncbi:N-acetylglucosamine-6-phosphate deacetylase [Pirellula sp. SH-Sr6A]|uniref:N-acetylglucosamine-6-phosphate deacetylase n=1 Tax=Pirellula sp. SH-Sr6A TaxID=1632865 RepID=UPI00078C8EA3|nr:N-acetylglucosamine-6-phosphate deacetylase [Pirellula sp. SH-Sr6A]AMV34289.1 N-acetylglucosamine-6-phosphate deacetylase [Pirellula sp. SH-Sr6A]
MKLVIQNARVILRDRILDNAAVVCDGGRITAVLGEGDGVVPSTDGKRIDLGGRYLSPGFIDIHVHGGLGADFMDGSQEAIELSCSAHLQHGVTTLFPTTTTASDEQILRTIDAVKGARETPTGKWPLPRIEGIHLYGPYFATEKSGCHNKEACRVPMPAEFERYFQTGLIRIATCAAELEGSGAFYRAARDRGCLVTCGHSNSSWSEMEQAFESGMRHVDHFWCAMSSVQSVRARLGTPMQGSMLEFVLGTPEMSTEVIADGWHLSPELLRFAWRMKGVDRLCLVSDCNRALDMPPGRYLFGDAEDGGWILSDGMVGRGLDGGLASSVVALDNMVRHMHTAVGVPLVDAVRMASLTPAERTGIAEEVGEIAAGKRADFVVLTNQLQVDQVLVGGKIALTN